MPQGIVQDKEVRSSKQVKNQTVHPRNANQPNDNINMPLGGNSKIVRHPRCAFSSRPFAESRHVRLSLRLRRQGVHAVHRVVHLVRPG